MENNYLWIIWISYDFFKVKKIWPKVFENLRYIWGEGGIIWLIWMFSTFSWDVEDLEVFKSLRHIWTKRSLIWRIWVSKDFFYKNKMWFEWFIVKMRILVTNRPIWEHMGMFPLHWGANGFLSVKEFNF